MDAFCHVPCRRLRLPMQMRRVRHAPWLLLAVTSATLPLVFTCNRAVALSFTFGAQGLRRTRASASSELCNGLPLAKLQSFPAHSSAPHFNQKGTTRSTDAVGTADGVINKAMNVYAAGALAAWAVQWTFMGEGDLYAPDECFEGRSTPIDDAPSAGSSHLWLQGRPLFPPFPEGTEQAMFAMGCLWCSENLYMRLPRGIFSTSVGYSGGVTPNPTYHEVCSGKTNHAEVVRVVFNPSEISDEELVRVFFEAHDPTTKNQQGNDFGTPYRSAIYCYGDEQLRVAQRLSGEFAEVLKKRNDPISTEIAPAGPFCVAEKYHQQYGARGSEYCGLRPTGAKLAQVVASTVPASAQLPDLKPMQF